MLYQSWDSLASFIYTSLGSTLIIFHLHADGDVSLLLSLALLDTSEAWSTSAKRSRPLSLLSPDRTCRWVVSNQPEWQEDHCGGNRQEAIRYSDHGMKDFGGTRAMLQRISMDQGVATWLSTSQNPSTQDDMIIALLAWIISRTFSANEQYFSLTINQPTVLSAMAYQPSEQGNNHKYIIRKQMNG